MLRILLLAAVSAFAQSGTSTIAGTVKDGAGSVIPAAQVTITNEQTGAVPVGQKANTTVSFFNPGQISPISYQFNLGIQRELRENLLLEAGYIGNVSHHLTANDLSLNQVAPQSMVRPFPQFNNVLWINPSIGNSTYHGVFIRSEKRMARSLAFLAHYTFSKFLDDVEASQEFGASGSYMDAYNRRLDKGRSGSDVPHRLVVTLLSRPRSSAGTGC